MAMRIEQDAGLPLKYEMFELKRPVGFVVDGSGSPTRPNGLEGQNSTCKEPQRHCVNSAGSDDRLGVADFGNHATLKDIAGRVRDDGAQDESAWARSKNLQHAVCHSVRQAQLHQQQAQPQQAPVRWERFLPQHQLRVLLVEDDDSTRHVVSALLRNCSYEVTSAANGLIAWELLMDQNSKVDLVLTEVVMPCLSGIGLLARIMSHEPLKHIPVIMMSSHDSMGVVFKCLSKGAVDFLVKPVRKNELKNLWQHIWRRCHSSSGSGSESGSESGSQTQKIAQPEAVREANNSTSNDESDMASSKLNIGGGSDNGSGTQSSWTRKAVEVESSHQNISDGLTLQLKSGCVSGAVHHGRKVNDSRGGSLAELSLFPKDEARVDSTRSSQEMVANTAVLDRDSRDADVSAEGVPFVDNWPRAALVGQMPSEGKEGIEEQQAESEDADEFMEKHASNSPSSKDKTASDSSTPPLLKLSLKRPFQENEGEHEWRGGLKHSCSSAFSRYQNSGNIAVSAGGNTKIHPPFTPFGDHSLIQGSSVGSIHPQNILCPPQTDRVLYSKVASDEVMVPSYYRDAFCKDDSSRLAVGSGKKVHYPSPTAALNTFDVNSDEPVSDPALPQHWDPSSEKVETPDCHANVRSSQGYFNGITDQDSYVHHHSHHHHHHHHHIQHHFHHHQDQLQPRPRTPQQEDSTLVSAAPAPKCGSSNTGKGGEGNNGQCGSSNGYGSNGNGAVSLNGSVSGSNNGSNGGQSAAPELTGLGNFEDCILTAGGSGVTVANHDPVDADQNRHARREAALNKFRRKRKERCFEKKVRYQSRKRLAEQRPRVRGQFVRQSVK